MSISLRNKKILLYVSSSLGEVVCGLSLSSKLKQLDHTVQIYQIGNQQNRFLIDNYPDIDTYIEESKLRDPDQGRAYLQSLAIDILIDVRKQCWLTNLAKEINIPVRIGNKSRLSQFLACTHTVYFSRKRSNLHESQINLKTLYPITKQSRYSLQEILQLNKRFQLGVYKQSAPVNLDQQKFNLIIHPLKGSRTEKLCWPIKKYKELISLLDPAKFHVYLTGSSEEGAKIDESLSQPFRHVTNLCGKLDLSQLTSLILHCDGLVGGSTGPVHLSAFLGAKTLALFSPAKRVHASRWGPIGKQVTVLQSGQPLSCRSCAWDKAHCKCLADISLQDVLQVIFSWSDAKSNLQLSSQVCMAP